MTAPVGSSRSSRDGSIGKGKPNRGRHWSQSSGDRPAFRETEVAGIVGAEHRATQAKSPRNLYRGLPDSLAGYQAAGA